MKDIQQSNITVVECPYDKMVRKAKRTLEAIENGDYVVDEDGDENFTLYELEKACDIESLANVILYQHYQIKKLTEQLNALQTK